jgi:hypothetical protein
VLSESDPTVTVSGTITCTSDECQLSATSTGPLADADGDGLDESGMTSENSTLDAEGGITGTGSFSVTFSSDDTSCTQAVSITGMLQ